MSEATDRLEAVRAARCGTAEEPQVDRVLSRVNIVWGICFAVLLLMFAIGRSVMTKEEAEKAFVRQDVYQRDYQHTTKQLDTIDTKLDRVVEALNARH